MGRVTKPMKTASFFLKMTPAEKRNLERLAAKRDVSLAYAMREGARMWLEETRVVRVGADGESPTV